MTTLAVFPLGFVREMLQMKARHKVAFDRALVERFGYARAQYMSPSVIYSTPDLSTTHCGNEPLVAYVGYSFSHLYDTARGCYISNTGRHVYPN